MVKRTGPQNLELKELINDLKILGNKNNINLWKRVAMDLEMSTRARRKANIYKINENTRDNEIALVPGKVLSMGDLTKKINLSLLNSWSSFKFRSSMLLNFIGAFT